MNDTSTDSIVESTSRNPEVYRCSGVTELPCSTLWSAAAMFSSLHCLRLPDLEPGRHRLAGAERDLLCTENDFFLRGMLS